MAISCFADKALEPDEAMLRDALGQAHARWQQLTAHILGVRPKVQFVWKMAVASHGWSLRAMDGKRNLIYLIPQQGTFLVAVVLGDKAFAAAQTAMLPEHVLAALNSATRYVEGTGIRLELASEADLAWVQQMLALKLAH
jgi:hypothetical protein